MAGKKWPTLIDLFKSKEFRLWFGVFGFSVLLVYILRPPLFPTWDENYYLISIKDGTPSSLQLGRMGYILYFHYWWKLLSTFHFNFYDFVDFLSLHSILVSGIFLANMAFLLHRITRNAYWSVGAVLLALTQNGFSETASAIGGDILMFGLISTSLIVFLLSHERRNQGLLLLSALMLGWSFGVREPTFFFMPLFLFVLYQHWSNRFSRQWYIAAVVVFVAFAAMCPIIGFYENGFKFLREFLWSFSKTNLKVGESFFSKVILFGQIHLLRQTWFAILVAIGFFAYLSRRRNWQELLFLVLLVVPGLLTIYIAEAPAVKEARFFLTSIIMCAFFATVACTFVWERFLVRRRSQAIVISLLAVAYLLRSESDLLFQGHKGYTEVSHNQWLLLRKNLTAELMKKAFIVAGDSTSQIRLHSAVLGSDAEIVDQGWGWPEGQLLNSLRAYSNKGYRLLMYVNDRWTDETHQNEVGAAFKVFTSKEIATIEGFYELKDYLGKREVETPLPDAKLKLGSLLVDDFPYDLALSDDDRHGWTLTPNVDFWTKGLGYPVLYKTTPEGFRDNLKTMGKIKWVVYGGHRTFGYGVPENRRWSDLIEQNLPNVEVTNRGVLNYSIDQIAILVRDTLDSIDSQTHVLVEIPTAESIEHYPFLEKYKWNRAKPYATFNDSGVEFQPAPKVRKVSMWTDCAGFEFALPGQYEPLVKFCYKIQKSEFERRGKLWVVSDIAPVTAHSMIIRDIQQSLHKKGAQIGFLCFDSFATWTLHSMGLNCFDLSKYHKPAYWLSSHYTMLNLKAHKEIAQEIVSKRDDIFKRADFNPGFKSSRAE